MIFGKSRNKKKELNYSDTGAVKTTIYKNIYEKIGGKSFTTDRAYYEFLYSQGFTKPEIRLFVRRNIAQISAQFVENICRQKNNILSSQDSFKKVWLDSGKIEGIPPSARTSILSKINKDIQIKSDACDVYISKIEQDGAYMKEMTSKMIETRTETMKMIMIKKMKGQDKSKVEIVEYISKMDAELTAQKLALQQMDMTHEKVGYSLKISMSLNNYTKLFGSEQKAFHAIYKENVGEKGISVLIIPDGYDPSFQQTTIQHEIRHSFEQIIFSDTMVKNKKLYTPLQFRMLGGLKSELTATFSKEDGRFINSKELRFEQFQKYDYIPESWSKKTPKLFEKTKRYQEVVRSSYFFYYDYMTSLNTVGGFDIEVVDLLSNQSFANWKTTVEDMEQILLKHGYNQDGLDVLRSESMKQANFNISDSSPYSNPNKEIDIDYINQAYVQDVSGLDNAAMTYEQLSPKR